jgi:SAM-dependent methyltransferase
VRRGATRSSRVGPRRGLSAQLLDVARRRARAEGLGNATFLHADAQVHPFPPASVDVVLSRTGTMFFGDPEAAFTNMARAARPDGRLVLLVWQSSTVNHWFRDFATALAAGRELPAPPPDAPGPFSSADPARMRSVLTAAGFGDVGFDGVAEPMYFGATAESAFRFVSGLGFSQFLLAGLDGSARTGALDALRASIEAHATDAGVLYPAAAWIITARRR